MVFKELQSDIGRLSQIVGIMSRHGFAPSLRRMPVVKHLVPRRTNDDPNMPAGERFARMLEELGPTFVKLGQILSTRVDLLPQDYTTALSRLQDGVPPFPFEAAKKVIEEELGQPLESAFASFEEIPLASASMAQVHAATLLSGQEVVVKVQRPGIGAQIHSDTSILVLVAQLLELVIREAEHYRASDLAEEFEDSLTAELDFTAEAHNLLAFARFNDGREGIVIPQIHPSLTSTRMLTMQRINGRRITELKKDGDTKRAHEITERLVMLNFEHVFCDGMFHGDPHPGNVLVDDDGNLCFIDFGLMGRMARDTQDRMLILMVALSLRDADTLARLLVQMGDTKGRVSLTEFRDQIRKLLDRYLGLTVEEVNSSAALADLVELSMRFGVRMPREFALLSKASVAIEGIVRTLYPGLDPSAKIAARSEELLLQRLDVRDAKGGGMRAALQVGLLATDLPTQLSQVLMDIERGNVEVTVRAPQFDDLDRQIRGLGMMVFGGLLSSSLLLGGIYVLAKVDFQVWGIPVLPLIALPASGALFGVAFTWFLTGGRLPKFPLNRLLSYVWARRKKLRGRSR